MTRITEESGVGYLAVILLLATALIVLLVQGVGGTSQTSTVETANETPSPTPTSAPPPEVQQLVASPTPAIHVALWWDEQIAQRDLDLVEELGFGWVKQKFAWRDIATVERGQYDWWRTDRIVEDVEERGLSLIVRLDRQPFWSQANGGWPPLENAPPADLQDFGDFCHAVAERYQGRIQAYQVWNEPNLAREWGEQPPNAAEYVDLLATCYEGIKSADPAAWVISAPLAPTGTGLPIAIPDDEYLIAMYEAGAADYFDMLGVNAPGYAASPQTSPGEAAANPAFGGQAWATFRHVETIRSIMVQQGDGHKQIAILEMGWTTDPVNDEYRWFAVSEQEQADYLAGAYWWARLNWQPWIGLMTTIYIPDPSWTPADEEYWWGVTFPSFPITHRRPAFYTLQGLPDWGGETP
ncbi:MAG: hypothetical protein GYB68_00645 [Chloroflexi bacterium]|nr:hypothetical protein [Chloroflexota bacterium]